LSAAKFNKTVIIADDHAIVRNGLKAVLSAISNTEIVGEAENGVEAIALCKTLIPDMMTLDASMPFSNGMEVYGEVRRWSSSTKIAVVTGFTAVGTLADWAAAEVDGLFLKSCDPEEMQQGFELILSGGKYIQEEIADKLKDKSPETELTQRERQILHLIAGGYSNNEIGGRLSISPKTVDNHRTRIMAKLNVNSVAQLVAHALKEGLLDNARQA